MRLFNNVRRWWRSHGHGVHSPLAFRLITEVFHCRYEYYADELLSNGAEPGWYRLVLRLICDFEPHSIQLSSQSSHTIDAIRLADSRIPVSLDGTHDVTMYSGKGTVLMCRDIRLNPQKWVLIKESLSTCGMTFTNGVIGVAVSRPDLPRQDFEIKF